MASVDLFRFACNISKNEVIFQHCDMACRILKWARNDWNLRKSNRRSYSQTDFTLEMSPSLGRSSVRVRWYESTTVENCNSICLSVFITHFAWVTTKESISSLWSNIWQKKARPHRRIGKLFLFCFFIPHIHCTFLRQSRNEAKPKSKINQEVSFYNLSFNISITRGNWAILGIKIKSYKLKAKHT